MNGGGFGLGGCGGLGGDGGGGGLGGALLSVIAYRIMPVHAEFLIGKQEVRATKSCFMGCKLR